MRPSPTSTPTPPPTFPGCRGNLLLDAYNNKVFPNTGLVEIQKLFAPTKEDLYTQLEVPGISCYTRWGPTSKKNEEKKQKRKF